MFLCYVLEDKPFNATHHFVILFQLFSRYEKHRQLIMEDILSSLARLPSSKKNLRNYRYCSVSFEDPFLDFFARFKYQPLHGRHFACRLNADESIQMVTALALELIQSVAKLPSPASDDDEEGDEEDTKNRRKSKNVDNEVLIVTSYETAMRTAHSFLAVFLRK